LSSDGFTDRRRFIRHLSDLPLSVVVEGLPGLLPPRLKDVSAEGISFLYDHEITPGTVIHISIGSVQPPFESDGRVVWCSKQGDDFQMGIEFLNVDKTFHARMVEQVCHIEYYRKEVMACEGRQLTSEEAAKEWISKYASNVQ
jgi:hypothetical protein